VTNIPFQSLPAGEDQHTLADEEHLEAADKQHILEDWQCFMVGGFRRSCFTERLYDFLCHSCAFIARRNRVTFWTTYFNAEAICLRMFLNQFGGNGRSVDFNTHAWLDGPAADLKQAMCRETARLCAPLLQVLEDLEQKHAELGRAWQAFAIVSGVPDPGFPPYYLISENTRNLLAYAARIALDQPQIILKGEGG
jgi:hypothetical protein